MSISRRHEEQQKKTFTNFVNVYLKDHDRSITELVELYNGVDLFFMMKSMYDRDGKDFPIFRKLETRRVSMHFVQKSNVQTLLSYFRETAGMPLHGITALDIVRQDLKIIMGLIWAIIQKYLVSASASEEEKAAAMKSRATSPYNQIVLWVNNVIRPEQVQVNQLEDWIDGKPIFALVKVVSRAIKATDVREAFIEECSGLSGAELIDRCIEFANDMMQIPPVCSSDAFVNPEKVSITTYVSYYRAYWKLMQMDLLAKKAEAEQLEAKLKHAVDELAAKEQEWQTDRQGYEERVAELLARIKELEEQVAAQKARIAELEGLLATEKEERSTEVSKLRQDMDEAVENLEGRLATRKGEWESAKAQLEQTLSTTQDDAKKMEEDLSRRLKQTEEELEQTREERTQVRGDLKETRTNLAEEKKGRARDVRELEEKLSAQTSESEKLRTKIEETVEAHTEEVADLKEKHVNEIQEKNDVIAEKTSQFEKEKTDLQSTLMAVESDGSVFQAEMRKQIDSKDSQIADQLKQIEELRAALKAEQESLLTEKKERATEVAGLTENLGDANKECDRLNAKIVVLEREHDLETTQLRETHAQEIKERDDELASRTETFKNDRESLETKLSDLRVESERVRSDLTGQLGGKVEELVSMTSLRDTLVVELKDEKTAREQEQQEATQAAEDADAIIADLEKQLADEKKAHAILSADHDELNADHEALTIERDKLNEKTGFLTDALAVAKDDIAKMEEEMDEIDEEIQASDVKFHEEQKKGRALESEIRQVRHELLYCWLYVEKATGKPYPGQERRYGDDGELLDPDEGDADAGDDLGGIAA